MTRSSKTEGKQQGRNRNSTEEAATAQETAGGPPADEGKSKHDSRAKRLFKWSIRNSAMFIALGALVISTYTCLRDDQRYTETMRPLAQSEEAANSMQVLHDLINSCEAMLESSDHASGVIGDLPAAIERAKNLQIDAAIAYNLKKYSNVSDCTREASETIKGVVAPEAQVDIKSGSNYITITACGGPLDFQGWAIISADNGTTATTKDGLPLDEITTGVYADMQPVPSNSICVLEFDLRPLGATFSQSITVTFHYLPCNVPRWFIEEDLVVASWNDTRQDWDILLDSDVDTSAHAITTSAVSRLTTFAVLAISPSS